MWQEEYSAEELYLQQLKVLEEENRKIEKKIDFYQRQMKKAKIKVVADVCLFLLFCLLVTALESVNFYMEIILFKYIVTAYFLLFAVQIKFFWDLFHLFGECGLPTFAKLFVGGIGFSCKNLLEEARMEQVNNQCRINRLKEKMEKEI